MTAGRRRSERRVVDWLVAKVKDECSVDWLPDFDAIAPSIVQKTVEAHLRQFAQRHLGTQPTTVDPGVNLTAQEAELVWSVFQILSNELDTDSSRRAWRDMEVATDFIFHKEVLGHETVMMNLCFRWGLSETVVKEAVRKYRDEARHRIEQKRLMHQSLSERFANSPEELAAVKAEGCFWHPDFAVDLSHDLRVTADRYRNGEDSELIPRAKRRREKKRRES